MTIDHFVPKSKGGTDDPENLIYCCARCNWHKHNFWSVSPAPQLWNPRIEPFDLHFTLGDDGLLIPLTETGACTLEMLRLNRQPLVEHRQLERRLMALIGFLLLNIQAFDLADDLPSRQVELMEAERESLQQKREPNDKSSGRKES